MSHNSTTVPANRNWILAALMFTIMLAAIDVTIISTAIPHIVGDLGGFSMFSWVFSIYLLTQTVTIPIYGKLSDLFGRKPILLFGMIIFLLGSLTSALSWNMLSLIIFRGVQGIGAGAIMATVNTIAGDIYTIEERAKIQGWLSSVWGMAAIIGPTLGGTFAEYLSWRWVFLVNLPIGIVAFLLIVVFFKERRVKQTQKVNYWGAVLMLLAGSSAMFTLMEGGNSWAWFSLEGIGMALLSLLLIGALFAVERRSEAPILPRWIWRNKILIGTNMAAILMGAIMLGPNMYLPTFAQTVLGTGAVVSGLILAGMSIGWPIASARSGRLYLKIGFRNTALIGTTILLIFSLFYLILPYQAPLWMYVLQQVLLGAGFGLLSTPTLVGVQSIVEWGERGIVTSSNMFSRYLGQTIGAAIIAGVFNGTLKRQFEAAPEKLNAQLPAINDLVDTLHNPSTSTEVLNYLQHSFYHATQSVYLLMAFFALIACVVLLRLPKKYPIIASKNQQKSQ